MEIDLRKPFTDEARAAFARFPAYELVGDRTVRFQQDEMALAYRMAAVAGPDRERPQRPVVLSDSHA